MAIMPPAMHAHLAFVGAILSAWPSNIQAFLPSLLYPSDRPSPPALSTTTCLQEGAGVADTYSWREEQFEIEIKLVAPPGTSAKDIKFKCSSDSIDLRLRNCDGDFGNHEEVVLLDGTRNMRGKICVDGTFWSIEGSADKDRQITVTIEKHFVPISSSRGTETYDTLTDFDWGGIYPNDGEEVSYRKYDEPEELNVREYASKLGVDIDNFDMSKVDKTMFGAGSGGGDAAIAGTAGGLDDNVEDGRDVASAQSRGFHFNVTRATLDQLTKVGLAKEVIQQGDGMEYELGSDGSLDEERKFSMLGKDISNDELHEAGIVGDNDVTTLWEQQTVPVEEAPGYQKTHYAGNALSNGIVNNEIVKHKMISSDSIVESSGMAKEVQVDTVKCMKAKRAVEPELPSNDLLLKENSVDPIDLLTVARLKEILREQGLKVSGTKQVLRDRLRGHVNQLLREE